ncbi:MAG: cupin domain-containing protein [Rhizobiaceae bacterium]
MKQNRFRWILIPAFFMMASPGIADSVYPPVDVLLQSQTTVIGQQVKYPDGSAQITAAIVTMKSGLLTGWHRHEAPLTAYILEGELTVDYGDNGKRVYRKGDTLIEALGSRHNGQNTGEGIARILVVFSGAVGTPNTVSE